MNLSELQNDIIKKVLSIEDKKFLESFKEMLSIESETFTYELSDFEQSIISESKSDYKAGNTIDHQSMFKKNKEWLEE